MRCLLSLAALLLYIVALSECQSGATPPPCADCGNPCQSVECSGSGLFFFTSLLTARYECKVTRASEIVSINVEQQNPSSNCIKDQNYGLSGDSIWISRGCSAKFKVCYQSAPCGIYTKGCHKDASCLRKGNTEYCACKAGYYGNGVDSCGAACTCTGSGDPHYKTFDGSMIHFQGICKYVLSELAIGSSCDYRVLVQNEHRRGNMRVSFTKRVDVEIRNTTISLRKDGTLFVNRERKYTPLEAEDFTFSIFMRGSQEIVVQTSCKVIVIYDGDQRVAVTVPAVYGGNMTGLCGNCNGNRGDDFLTKNKLDVSKEQDHDARIGNSFAVPDPETPPEICAMEDVKITCSPEFKGLAASNDYCGLLRNTTGPFADFIKKEPTISENIWTACLFDVCSDEEDLVEAKKTACDALENFAKTIQETGFGKIIWRTVARCPLTCGENMEYSMNVGPLPTCSDGVQAEKFDVSPVDGCTCKPGFVQSGNKCVRKEECGCKVGNQYLPVGETFVTEDCRFLNQCQYKNEKSQIVSVENRPTCHKLAQCKPNETTGQYMCQCQKEFVGDGIISCIAACGNTKKPCHPNAICTKGKVTQPDQCRCKEGYYGDGTENCTKSCECVASGDPHYTTFDGQKIHFQGLCKYTMASIPYCSVNVEVKNQPVPGTKVSTTKLLDVKLSSTNIRIGQKKKLLINGEIAYAPVEGVGYRIYEKGSMVVETDCGVIVMFDGVSTARVLIPSQYGNTVTGICGNCDGIQNDFRTKNGRIVSGETNKYSLIGDSYAVPDETDQGPDSCKTESIDPTCPQEWEIKKRSNEYCGLILDPKGPFGPCLAKYPEIAKGEGVISDCTYDVCANSDDPKNAQEAACTALAMLAYSCQQKSDIDVIVWRKPDFCPLKECGLNMAYNPAITECPATCQDPMRRTPCHAGLSEGCECKPGFFRSGAACVPREGCGCVVQRKYYPLNTTVTSSDCRKKYICVHKDGSSYMQKLEDSPPCGEKASCRLNDEGHYQCQCDKNYNGDGFTCEKHIPTQPPITCSDCECRSVECPGWRIIQLLIFNQQHECEVTRTSNITSISVEQQYLLSNCIKDQNYGLRGNSIWVNRGCSAKFKVCYKKEGPERPCGIYTKGCHQDASCLRKDNTEYCACKAGYYGNGVDSCGAACTCTGSGDPHYKTFDGSMIHFQGICKYVLSELAIGSSCDYRVLVQNEHRHGNTRVSFTKRVDVEIRNTTISLRKDRALFVNKERKYTPLEAEDLTFSIFMRGSQEIVVQTSCKVVVIYDGNQRVSVTVPEVYGRNMTGLCGNCNGNRGDDFLTKNKLDVSKEQDRYALIGNSFVVPDTETPPEICQIENVKITCSPEFKGLAASNDYCGLLKNTTGPFGDFIKKEPTISENIWDACLIDVCSDEEDLVEAKKTACDALENFAKTIQENERGNIIWRTVARCPLTCGENMEYSMNVGTLPTCSDGVQAEKFDVSPVDGCTCKPGFVQSGDKCVRKEECGCKVGNQYLPVGETFVTENCRILKQCQYKNGKSEVVSVENRPACRMLAQCKPNEITGQYTCQCQKGFVGDGIKGCIAACGTAKKPCHPNAICSTGKVKQPDQCRCKEGYYGDGTENCTKSCECVASGDPHYTTFDGQKIHFQGRCKYTMASIPYCSVNVEVKNQPVPGTKVSTTKLLDVKLSSTNIRIGQKKKLLINGEIAYAPVEGVGYRIYEKGSMVVETDCGVIVMFDGANTARVLVPSQYGKNVTGICGNCDGIQNDFMTKNGRSVSGETNKYSLIGDSYAVPDDTEHATENCKTETINPTCPQEWESKKRSNEYCGLILDPKGPFGSCLAKYPEIAKGDGVISDCNYDVCANSDDPKNAQDAACTALATLAYSCQQKSDIDVIAWRTPDFCPLKECGLNMVYNPAITECPATCKDPMRRTPCHAGLSEGCECKPGFFRIGAACVSREGCGCAVQGKYYPLNTTVTSSDCRKRYICVHKDGSSYMEKLEDFPPCGAKASCRLNDNGHYQCQCNKNYNGDGFKCESPCGIYAKGCHQDASCLRKGNTEYCACKAGYYGNGVDSCGAACTCTGSGDPHYKTFDGSMIHFQGICKYVLSELAIGSSCDYRVLVQNEHRHGNTRVSFTKRVDVEIRNTTISLRKDRALFVNKERKYTPLEAEDLTFSIFMRGSQEIVVQTSCKVVVIYDGNQRVSVTVPEVYGRNMTGLCGNCNGNRGDDFLTKNKLDVSKEQDRYALIGNSFVVPDTETPPEICSIENVKITCSPEFKGLAASNDYCGLLKNTTGPFGDFIKKEPTISENIWDACLIDVCSDEEDLVKAKKTACDALENFAKTIQENERGNIIWRTVARCPLTCGENMEYSMNVGTLPTCSDGVQAEKFDVSPVDGCTCKPGFVQSGDKCVRKEECGCKVGNQYLPVGETFVTEDCRILKQCQYKNGKSEVVSVENRPACHMLAQCKPNEITGQYTCQCQKGFVGDGIKGCIAACGTAKKPCHPNAICSTGKVKQPDQCRCKEGYYGDGTENCTKSCECVASGDPHYTTFDGQKIHFQGRCKYTMASIPYCSVNVEVKNQPVPGTKVSTTKLLDVKLSSTNIRIGQKKKLLINGEIAYAPAEGIGYRIYEKGSMVVETDCGVIVMFDGANTARVLVPSQYGKNVTGICGNCDGIQNDFMTKNGRSVSGETNKYSLIGDSYAVPDDTELGTENCQTETINPTCPQEWESKKRSNEYCGLILDPKGPFGSCLAKYPEIARGDGVISDCNYDVCANSDDPKNAQDAACTALATLAYSCQQKSDIDVIAWRTPDFCPLKECGLNMVYNPAITECPATCKDPMRRTPCHAGLSEGCECKPGFFRSGAACVSREGCGCAVQGKYYPLNTTVTSSDCRKRYICVHKDGSSYMEKLQDSLPCGANASCRLNDNGHYQCQCNKNYKGDGFTCETTESTVTPSQTTRVPPSPPPTTSSTGRPTKPSSTPEGPCGIHVCHEYASCLSKGNIQYCACYPGYYGNGVDSCGDACTCTGSGDPHYNTFDGSMIHFQGICKYVLSELAVGSQCDYRVLVQNEHRHGNTRVSFTKRVDVEIGSYTISLRKDRALFVNKERKYTPLEAKDLSFSIFMRGSQEIVVQTSCKVMVIYDGNQRVSVTAPDVYGRNMTGLCGNCNGDRGDDFLTKDKLDVSKEQDRYARIGNSFVVPDPDTPPGMCPTEDVKIKCTPEFQRVANSTYYCGLLSDTTGPFADFIRKEPDVAAKFLVACLFDVCSYEDNLVEAKRTACDTLDSFAKTLDEKGLGKIIWRTSERCPLRCGENMEYSTNVGALPTCSDMDGVQAAQFDVPTVDGCRCKQGFVLSGDKCVRREECGCKVDNQYLPIGEKFVTEDCRLLKQCQYKNGKSEIVTVENRPACHKLAQCKPNETTGQYTCQCQTGTVGDGIIRCIEVCGNANKPCHPNAICSKGKGKQPDQCRCKEGYYGDGIETCTESCECVASGDPHYTTFDGQKIHFQGLCKYTMASIPYCSVNVEVKNQPVPGNKVSTTKLLDVKLPSTNIRIGQKKKLLINGEIAYAPVEGVGYRIYEKGSMVVETDCGVIVMFDGANTARVLVPSQYGKNVTGICGNCDGVQNDFMTKNGRSVSGETNKYSLIGDSYVVPDDTEHGTENCKTETINPTCPQEWESKKRSNEYCGLILDPKGPFGPCLAKYPEIAKGDGVISDCTYDVCANSDDPKNAQDAACTALATLAYSCQQKSDIDVIVWRKPDFCPLKECGLNMVYNPAITECPATCKDPMRRIPCHAGLSEGCECKPGFFRSGAACVSREGCGCVVQGKYYPLNTTVTSSDCRKRYICVHKDGSSYMEKLEDSLPCGANASCRLNDNGHYQCQCNKNYKGDGFTCETTESTVTPSLTTRAPPPPPPPTTKITTTSSTGSSINPSSPPEENGTCLVSETTTGCRTVKIIKGNCYYTSNIKSQCRYVVKMINVNSAMVYIGDNKVVRLDPYNTKEYKDCATFKMEYRQVTVTEPACGCE